MVSYFATIDQGIGRLTSNCLIDGILLVRLSAHSYLSLSSLYALVFYKNGHAVFNFRGVSREEQKQVVQYQELDLFKKYVIQI